MVLRLQVAGAAKNRAKQNKNNPRSRCRSRECHGPRSREQVAILSTARRSGDEAAHRRSVPALQLVCAGSVRRHQARRMRGKGSESSRKRCVIPLVVKLPVVFKVDREAMWACTKTALQLLASPADFQRISNWCRRIKPGLRPPRSVFHFQRRHRTTPEQTLAFAVIDERFRALSRGGESITSSLGQVRGLSESADWGQHPARQLRRSVFWGGRLKGPTPFWSAIRPARPVRIQEDEALAQMILGAGAAVRTNRSAHDRDRFPFPGAMGEPPSRWRSWARPESSSCIWGVTSRMDSASRTAVFNSRTRAGGLPSSS